MVKIEIGKVMNLKRMTKKNNQPSKFKFVVLKIQLNNPSKNRCYMEANKPFSQAGHAGTIEKTAGTGEGGNPLVY